MHRYTTKNKTTGVVERFAQLPPLSNGYWWINKSSLGSDVNDWHEVPEEPKHDTGLLFGYPVDQFLAKQYR